MFTVSPLTQKKIKAFKNIKRGYWSFIVLATLLVLSLFAELLVNSKALRDPLIISPKRNHV